MTQTAPNRDLSKLSELLATHTHPTEKKTQPTKARAVKPANDNKPARELLAWPTFERLAYRGDMRRLHALRHWRNVCFPGSEPTPPEPDSLDADTRAEIRPSEGELLAAVGWTVTGRERWHWTGRMVNVYAPVEAAAKRTTNQNGGEDTGLGELLFRDGKLIVWGHTAKGVALRPVERPGGPKGGPSSERSTSAIWSYLRLKGATSPLAATPYSRPLSGEAAIATTYEPLPREEPNAKNKHGRFGVEQARAVLKSLGVDGSTPFDQLQVPATRCPDGIVTGPQWVGGVKKPKPMGEISAAAGREPDVVRQVENVMFVEFLRHHLGKHALVLDLAIGDATAKQIGIEMGQGPAYAEKRGPALIDAAIDALIQIDETARLEIDPPQEKLAA
ncbi:hypothetical protein OIU34_28075 [Pararhizobium sp. BT-229]|uniref:hypothetical protein n=1 Tax=Pararhizobium sp. BT-229 TaxID=2986923 RepID=UPI0021F7888D|nr:hypothetical protein [Pararhizobium sp. BT-229]MCV9965732.1 hypothetical protein [Pararhizobium sp. BT-229]